MPSTYAIRICIRLIPLTDYAVHNAGKCQKEQELINWHSLLKTDERVDGCLNTGTTVFSFFWYHWICGDGCAFTMQCTVTLLLFTK